MKQKSAFIGTISLLLMLLLIRQPMPAANAKAATPVNFDSYHSPAQVNQVLKDLANSHPDKTKLHKIAVSPGGRAMYIMEIGPETNKPQKTLPAVFVGAGFEGLPIASEAALYLAKLLLEKPEAWKDKTWYILPLGNPDASARYFQKPLHADSRNDHPHNDDMDDGVDEDGVEDLDGNGIITMMRVKDPEGSWMPVEGEPRLMKKADWSKDEKGIYTLYTEGIDNDGDGQYNEDGPGGVNAGINFPHLFKPFTKDGGEWAGCIDETYNLFQFIFQHPEIAITVSFGETNFCMVPPRGGRKTTADFTKIKIPERMAKRFSMDPEKTYTMEEILDLLRPQLPPGMEIDESMVASFLGLGAAVNPLGPDLKFYNTISEKYKDFIKANKLDAPRLEPQAAKDGSFELWAYYHLGVPTFALDLWSLPKPEDKNKTKPELTREKLETMSKEDFLALDKEKIAAFLESSGAPASIKVDRVIEMVKSDKMTPKRMAEMMKNMPQPKSADDADPLEKALLAFSEKELKGNGFVDWKPFQHPTLGEVEIGGAVPFTCNTPPAHMLENVLKGQVPWALVLADKAARVKLANTKVTPLGSGLYRIEAWIENAGFLPYPTAMGKRNKRITPIAAELTGNNFKILEGKKRLLIKELPGRGAAKVQWVVRAEKRETVNIEVSSFNAWSDAGAIQLGGAE